MQYALVSRKFSYCTDDISDYFSVLVTLPIGSAIQLNRYSGGRIGYLEANLYCRIYKHRKDGKVSVESICGGFAWDVDPKDIEIVPKDSIPVWLKDKYLSGPLDIDF